MSSRLQLLQCIALLCLTTAHAAILKTNDGLALHLSDDGQVAKLVVGEAKIPLIPGGGFVVRDVVSGKTAELRAPLTKEEGAFNQHGALEDLGLKLDTSAATSGEYLSFTCRLEDTTGQDRALDVAWELPLDARGWQWSPDILHREPIGKEGVYRATAPCALGPGYTQVYPFTSLAKGDLGLSLALQMAQGPRITALEYDATRQRFVVHCFLALSRAVKKYPGQGWFSFLLYRHDGSWGLRSAAERYYRLFPADFARRVPYEAGFYSGNLGDEAYVCFLPGVRDFGRVFSMMSYQYPGSTPIHYQTTDPTPPTDETIWRLLHDMAAAQAPGRELGMKTERLQVLGQLREVTSEEPAQSILARLCTGPDGSIAQYDTRAGLPYPNAETVSQFIVLQEYAAPSLCGVLEADLRRSLATWQRERPLAQPLTECFTTQLNGVWERKADCRPEHLAITQTPLAYEKDSRKPAITDQFWEWNSQVLQPLSRQHGFLLASEIAAGTFVGANLPFFDVLGVSDVSLGEPSRPGLDLGADARTLAYQRVLSYSPAWKETGFDAVVNNAFQQGLLYAMLPGLVAKADKYRPLYQRFVPVIEQLSAAGWEPVTYAQASDPDFRVERYGGLADMDLAFAIRNTSSERRRATLRIQAETLELPMKPGEVDAEDLLDGGKVAVSAAEGDLLFPVDLEPGEATAISVLSRSARIRHDLRRAFECLSEAADLESTAELTYQVSRPAQFVRGGTPESIGPERILTDGWSGYQGMIWQAGDPVEIALNLQSSHRLRGVNVIYGPGKAFTAAEAVLEGQADDGKWVKLASLPAQLPSDKPSATAIITDAGEYQALRLRYPTVTGQLWFKEIELAGQDMALMRAAQRFSALALVVDKGDAGTISQLALALRTRRLGGYDKTLQERALDYVADCCSLLCGVRVSLEMPARLPAETPVEATIVVQNTGGQAFREGSIKLRLPPGWRAAPSKVDLDPVAPGQTVRATITLFPAAGQARLTLLTTGVVGLDTVFLSSQKPAKVEAAPRP